MPTWFITGFSNFMVFTHIVPYATDTGVTAMQAASLISVMGFVAIPAGILLGRLSDKMGRKIPLCAVYFLRAGALVGLIQADELWMFTLFAVLFGVAYGGNLVMIPKLTASIFGVRSMGSVYGGISVSDGIGFAIGPILAGYIFDVSGTYNLSFWMVSGGMFMAVLFTVMLKER